MLAVVFPSQQIGRNLLSFSTYTKQRFLTPNSTSPLVAQETAVKKNKLWKFLPQLTVALTIGSHYNKCLTKDLVGWASS